jgi:hypothetical protein
MFRIVHRQRADRVEGAAVGSWKLVGHDLFAGMGAAVVDGRPHVLERASRGRQCGVGFVAPEELRVETRKTEEKCDHDESADDDDRRDEQPSFLFRAHIRWQDTRRPDPMEGTCRSSC